MSSPKSGNLWFVSPVEREAYEKLQAENEQLRKALRKIKRLQAKWQAPISSDDWGESNRRWAPVGSEAHKIAVDALGDTEHE